MDGKTNSGVFNPRNLGLYTYTANNPINLLDPTGNSYVDPRLLRTGSAALSSGPDLNHNYSIEKTDQAFFDTVETAGLVTGMGAVVYLGKQAIKDGAKSAFNKIKSWFPKKSLPVPKDLPKNIHMGQQGKHIKGHNNYMKGRSTLLDDVDPQKLLDGVHSGDYKIIGKGSRGNPIVDFGKPIGRDGKTGELTQYGQLHSGKSGTHIVPHNKNLVEK